MYPKKFYRCSIRSKRNRSTNKKSPYKGLIEESMSSFVAPVTLAFKKEDGRKTRLCIDFRELNKLIINKPQFFPRIEEIMIKAGNCYWYIALDINLAFWSISLRFKDR